MSDVFGFTGDHISSYGKRAINSDFRNWDDARGQHISEELLRIVDSASSSVNGILRSVERPTGFASALSYARSV